MADDTFDPAERSRLIEELRSWFDTELNRELGGFEAEFLLDFITGHIGAYYYNRGLLDARALLESRIETIGDALFELEKPTTFAR